MMIKVFDLLRGLLWYIVIFIYNLIDSILLVIKKLNAFNIIGSLSNNDNFVKYYNGVIAISLTLFCLFIIWKFIDRILNPDESISTLNIIFEIIKCGIMIMLSTFLFTHVSNFSIALSNYTGNLFENSSNTSLSNSMLSMFITYRDGYRNSEKFEEEESIEELVNSGKFNSDELYIDKYVTKSRIILSDEKDYKYDVNWIMAILCGGFYIYSLFFASIMLGRRQIEFLFLFSIAPIVFATSVGSKQRRGAVIEQLVSLTLQSAIVMLIVSLSVMAMQEVNVTTFFDNNFANVITKVILYLGCATFILTGSGVVNRFIGANVSAASGREQLMSLIGYGKLFKTGSGIGASALIGSGMVGA